jgi:hypothetical protein
MQLLVIMTRMTRMTIIYTQLDASALIQQDPNLISIDGFMLIKIASISWQGWKIETREPEIMKLI